jgi:hypothetical protein
MTMSKIRFVRPDVPIPDIATEISELGGRPGPGRASLGKLIPRKAGGRARWTLVLR